MPTPEREPCEEPGTTDTGDPPNPGPLQAPNNSRHSPHAPPGLESPAPPMLVGSPQSKMPTAAAPAARANTGSDGAPLALTPP